VLLTLAGRMPAMSQDRAVYLIVGDVVTPAGIAFLFTGLAFSLSTRWGFARYAWVTIKWAGTIALGGALVLGLGPAVAVLAALSDTGVAADELAAYDSAVHGAVGWTATLLLLTVSLVALSVFKPGRARTTVTSPASRRLQFAGVASALALGAILVLQARTLEHYRALPVEAVPVTLVPAGRHAGHAEVGGFDYGVEVITAAGRIDAVRVTRNRESVYAVLGARVVRKIVDAQSVCVDWVTGASTTSRAIQAAAADALASAAPAGTPLRRCDPR